jgi:hypothetical protein
MQGIQLFHYKYLLEQLQSLRDTQMQGFTCEHSDMILEQEEKLKKIYADYQHAMEDVSAIIKQFSDEKHAIKRLMFHHKQCLKQVKKRKMEMMIINKASQILILINFFQHCITSA